MLKQIHTELPSGGTDHVLNSGKIIRGYKKILPLIPLLILAGIVPLVVFLKISPVPAEYRQFWVTDYVFDFFSYYKAQVVVACAGLILAIALGLVLKRRLPLKKNSLYLPLAIYTMMIIASTIVSKAPSIALGGFSTAQRGCGCCSPTQ